MTTKSPQRQTSFRKLKRSWYKTFWWLDVIYPLVLSALLVLGISNLVYRGEKHRRLSSLIEEKLLSLSLMLAGPRAPLQQDTIRLVSVPEESLDLAVKEVLRREASYVVLMWPASASIDSPHHQQLVRTVNLATAQQKVLIASHPKQVRRLRLLFGEPIQIAEADPCQDETQLLCIYNPEWRQWLGQILIQDLWLSQHNALAKLPAKISANVPRMKPAYLLHLNAMDTFRHYDLVSLRHEPEKALQDTIVVIGSLTFKAEESVRTVVSEQGHKKNSISLAPHVFWAQLAQLFIDDGLITIVPQNEELALAGLLATLIACSLLWWGLGRSLGFFCALLILAPCANAAGIAFFAWYCPLFDSIYFGFATLVIGAFAKLSLASFASWRLKLLRQAEEDLGTMKSNFIAMISHNLTTPVAKMKGMLDIVAKATNESSSTTLSKVQALVAEIQLSTTLVLASLRLEEHQRNEETLPVDLLAEEMQRWLLAQLAPLGIRPRVQIQCVDSEGLLLPVTVDKKLLFAEAASKVLLDGGEVVIELCEETGLGLRVQAEKPWQGEWLRELAHTVLQTAAKLQRAKTSDQLIL
jgi:signal transduction histidine kinase